MEEKLMKVLCDALHYTFDEEACVSTLDLKKTVANLIAAGVTIPVRCKDCDKCIYTNPTAGLPFYTCIKWVHWTRPDDFCSYGVAKEG